MDFDMDSGLVWVGNMSMDQKQNNEVVRAITSFYFVKRSNAQLNAHYEEKYV